MSMLKKAQEDLVKWGKQKWRTSDGSESKGKKRYLPDSAWKSLSSAEKTATNAAKAKGNKEGKQHVPQPKKIAEDTAKFRMAKGGQADGRLKRAGVSGYNKPKRTPNHPKKSHIVVAKVGDKIKTIRFGEQGASTAGKPKEGESAKMKAKRKSFKARHRKNIAKGKLSAAYWADKVKW